MKDSGRLTLLRVEGLPVESSYLGCYVTVDGRLYDIITPLTLVTTDSIPIPPAGNLRFVIRYMTKDDRVLGGTALPISMLPENCNTWLPLKKNFDGEVMTTLVGDVRPPRILVCCNFGVPSAAASPAELPARDEPDSRLRVVDPLRTPAKDTQGLYIVERQKMRIQKQTSVIADLTQQLTDMRSFVSKQSEQESLWRKLFGELKSAAEESARKSKLREDAIGNTVREIEAKSKSILEENMRMKRELLGKDSETYQLREENSMLKAQVVMLTNDVPGRDDHALALENSTLRKRTIDLEGRVSALESELAARTAPNPPSNSFLDEAISEFFDRAPQPPVSKVSPGVYALADEQFALSFSSGMLLVKAKSGYLLLSEFLRMKGVPVKKNEEFIVEFPAMKALPVIRSVPSPIRHRGRGKPDQTSESGEDADSTFQTDISNLIQELEFDASNPLGSLRRAEASPGSRETKRVSRTKDNTVSPKPLLRFDPTNKRKGTK